MRIKIPKKLEPFVTKQKRFKVAFGGRGAAKSVSFASILAEQAANQHLKIGCFREYQNSIEESVYSLLLSQIADLQIPGYSSIQNKIDHSAGGCFRFRGLSRNPDAVKSMFGFRKFWVEEGQSLSKSSLDILTPTVREDNSEIWISANLMSSADPLSQRFIEPFRASLDRDGYYEDDLHLVVKINWRDNPWFPAVLNQERLFDYHNKPRNEYEHIWEGEYNDQVEGSIILPEWFEAAIDAHKRLGFRAIGRKIAVFDPSDQGDPKGFVERHGSVITRAEQYEQGDCNDGVEWALGEAISDQVDLFVWDCDGLGVALKNKVSSHLAGKRIDWSMFKGSEGVHLPHEIYGGGDRGDQNKHRTNEQVFKNRRAQFYGALRDRFYNTWRAVERQEYVDPELMISISSEVKHLNKFKSEVCRIPKKNNPNGLFQIMDKKTMMSAPFNLPSPNISDSAMMSLFIGDDKDDGIMAMPGSSARGGHREI